MAFFTCSPIKFHRDEKLCLIFLPILTEISITFNFPTDFNGKKILFNLPPLFNRKSPLKREGKLNVIGYFC